MDNYLIDRETLEKFVDELMKRKPVPVSSVEQLQGWREQKVQELDEKIGEAVFGTLDDQQLEEMNQMLDRNEESPEVFQEFFKKAGVNLENVISEAMQAFGAEYFGGENE